MPMPLKNACTVPRGEALSKNEVVEEHVDARPMEFRDASAEAKHLCRDDAKDPSHRLLNA